jgi:VanZ family protein
MSLTGRWTLWGIYVAIWTTGLLLPLGTLDSIPEPDFVVSRKYLFAKSIHVIAYAFLALFSAWLRVPARYRWLLIFFIMAHATATEHLQLLVDRGGSLFDVGYDTVGITVGIILSWNHWVSND